MKKILATGVVILFISVAFVPSLYADAEIISEQQGLVEIPIQICGLGGIKEHTAKLSKEDAVRLDTMFVDIHRRLNASESREETIYIYKEAVVELDSLGLLGGYSVEQVQELVTRELFENSFLINLLGLLKNNKLEPMDNHINSQCYINGEVTNSTLYPCFYIILRSIPILGQFIFNIFHFHMSHKQQMKTYLGYITFGHSFHDIDYYEDYYYPSEGWIRTEGTNGIIEQNGSFYGLCSDIYIPGSIIQYFEEHIGAEGFTGLKVGNSILGYAQEVKLSSSPPI